MNNSYRNLHKYGPEVSSIIRLHAFSSNLFIVVRLNKNLNTFGFANYFFLYFIICTPLNGRIKSYIKVYFFCDKH